LQNRIGHPGLLLLPRGTHRLQIDVHQVLRLCVALLDGGLRLVRHRLLYVRHLVDVQGAHPEDRRQTAPAAHYQRSGGGGEQWSCQRQDQRQLIRRQQQRQHSRNPARDLRLRRRLRPDSQGRQMGLPQVRPHTPSHDDTPRLYRNVWTAGGDGKGTI